MAVSQLVGAKIHRREDPRLITGHGRYTDDLTRTGLVHLAVVRSPHAHARIKSIGVEAAKKSPGVLGVFTAQDFKDIIAGPATHPVAPVFAPDKKVNPPRYPIAREEVCYQGEPVAVVVAEQRYQAADAAQLVDVEYDPLPAVMEIEEAMKPGSPKAHTDQPDNIAWDATYVPWEATEEAFKTADVVVKQRILQRRLSPNAIESRVVMAEYDPFDKRLTMWMSTQNPHWIRLFVSGALGMGEHSVRVVSHDVGGGFGSKISPYPEDYLVPAVSKLVERPVKWTETRTEAVQNAYAGRGQIYDVEASAKKDGTLLGMRVTQLLDCGAYIGTFGAFQTCACLLAGGAYKWKAISSRSIGVLTNKITTDPYRGAGRPEATHVAERMIDLLAVELKMDPVELRRKNFPAKEEFPFTQNFGLVMDSGDYNASLDKALKLFGYDQMRREQAEARKQGKLVGIGLSTWIEICGLGPGAVTGPATGGVVLSESAQVKVHPAGGVSIYVGTHNHGQGNDTTHAQIAADALGVPIEQIDIRHGDTNEGPGFGYGTYGSRTLAVGGVAINRACAKVVEKGKKVAAHILEAAEEDIVFDQGKFHVKGAPDKSKAFGEVAFAAYGQLPAGLEQGLEAVAYFEPPNFVWPFGAHICAVEVDAETGNAQITKYVAVDDCGNIINPMIVDGQLHGGIAQSIGQALYEEMVYDQDGQLRSATFLDYTIPSMNEIPNIQLDRTITPSPTNELGVKGIGEAGTIAATAAIINAICDAVSPLGIKHVDMPATPDRLWNQIKEARK
ncbi:MAG: xanthine dehydrogenase family protein molybdopterin-binding subunit [Chloroflexi bacterium]|nr:MAG: xanthine dehydrogenase family protein molybdopterin-binding subunit [Chloroflexota bacterium]TME95694.1 MAG: xanthine dehydrogenase family protein molybdopterin-binding subunit [Chloroflexota bacterium]